MTVCQIYADMVVKAATEWNGQCNVDLYRLIADALMITPTQMWQELGEIAEECNDYSAEGGMIHHREVARTRQRLTPEPPVAAGISPAATNE
jgi:hypothetical protein